MCLSESELAGVSCRCLLCHLTRRTLEKEGRWFEHGHYKKNRAGLTSSQQYGASMSVTSLGGIKAFPFYSSKSYNSMGISGLAALIDRLGSILVASVNTMLFPFAPFIFGTREGKWISYA